MEGYNDGNEVGDREGKGEAGFVVVGRREGEEYGGVELDYRAAGCREGEEDGGVVGDLSDWFTAVFCLLLFSPKIMRDISRKGAVTFIVDYDDGAKAIFVVFECPMK
jgi:hypothetical protein